MKIVTSFLLLTLLAGATATANNVRISSMYTRAQDIAQGTHNIRIDLSWDNSWRTSTIESNYDAVWVFAKFRRRSSPNGPWYHATLKNAGSSTFIDGTTINGSASSPTTITVPSDKKGAFVYRSEEGIGNMELKGLELVWDYKADGLFDADSIAICVYGIEMVYIPEGPFYVGDGSLGTISTPSLGYFIKGTTSNTPFQITSENALEIGNDSPTKLWCTTPTGATNGIGGAGVLPPAFPKGFKGFYLMKYAITQGQYRDFLNKLQQSQQYNRGYFFNIPGKFFNGSDAPVNRNGIRLAVQPTDLSKPRIYDLDLNNDGNSNQADDGEGIPCAFIMFLDVTAYLDWAALRPITELEFEKACRGPAYPLPSEKAWGTASAFRATSIINPGTAQETPNAYSNCTFGYYTTVAGPVRVGSFAAVNASSPIGQSRELAGASYYGAMEMSGNLNTLLIDVASGRGFDGSNGDGNIDASTGNCNNAGWPTQGGFRGGSFASLVYTLNVSDRSNATQTSPSRWYHVGGRGGRSIN